MFRKTILAALVPALAVSVAFFSSRTEALPQGTIGPASLCDSIPTSPVLVYNLTGGTLTGTLHTQLTVYSDGLATISRVNQPVFPVSLDDVGADLTYVAPTVVKGLVAKLRAAGAFALCDQSIPVADIPLTTITVFAKGTSARAHSFSYWIGFNEYQEVQTIVRDFIDTTFPGY